ncbi:hypothetical protein Salat_1569800 [Sesamum alatum]|uniref:Uncharacterized protein n=1 Tax=Sesamum alatum TaxID=300844 RepID=A0AAE1YE80_9LAMI|nr:hypothetical protein Salat_1569800 [Sesamum alatum]
MNPLSVPCYFYFYTGFEQASEPRSNWFMNPCSLTWEKERDNVAVIDEQTTLIKFGRYPRGNRISPKVQKIAQKYGSRFKNVKHGKSYDNGSMPADEALHPTSYRLCSGR